jgi:hypothetical protein
MPSAANRSYSTGSRNTLNLGPIGGRAFGGSGALGGAAARTGSSAGTDFCFGDLATDGCAFGLSNIF